MDGFIVGWLPTISQPDSRGLLCRTGLAPQIVVVRPFRILTLFEASTSVASFICLFVVKKDLVALRKPSEQQALVQRWFGSCYHQALVV